METIGRPIYFSPSVRVIDINLQRILCQSKDINNSSDNNHITCDYSKTGWTPGDEEQVLVCHNDFALMKNGGVEVGEFFGKVRFLSKEITPQRFICCVTDRRLILFPQNNKILELGLSVCMSISGVPPIMRRLLKDKYMTEMINYPLFFPRDTIISAEFSTDWPDLDNPILVVKFNDGELFLRNNFEKCGDIHISIVRPEFL